MGDGYEWEMPDHPATGGGPAWPPPAYPPTAAQPVWPPPGYPLIDGQPAWPLPGYALSSDEPAPAALFPGEVPQSAPPGPPAGGRGSRSRRTIRTALVSAVAAGALAVAGVSIASAQSSGSTTTTPGAPAAPTTPTTLPGTPPGRGFAKGGGFRPGGFRPGAFGIGGLGGGGGIHGEFVRPSGTGYQTVDTQMGKVTAVSPSSITVVSADGFSKTYGVDTNTLVNAGRDGINSVKVGDTVQLQAIGATATTKPSTTTSAVSIVDTTTLGPLRQHARPVPPPAGSTPSTTTP